MRYHCTQVDVFEVERKIQDNFQIIVAQDFQLNGYVVKGPAFFRNKVNRKLPSELIITLQ